MKVTAIVQARMNSSRLPGKVLLPLAGRPVLEHVVNRINFCKTIDEIVVSTSIEETDNPLRDWCQKKNVN